MNTLTTPRKNHVRLVLTLAMVTLLSAILAPAASALAASSNAPTQLKVLRTGPNMDVLSISWKSVPDTHHYTIAVFDGTKDNVFTVPGDATSATYDTKNDVCSRYQVTVTATNEDGVSATTNSFLVDRLAPGGITNAKASRTVDGDSATISWSSPVTSPQQEPTSQYKVVIRQLSNNKIVADRVSPDTTEAVKNLDPDRQYVANVTAENSFGSCYTSKIMIFGSSPTKLSSPSAIRDVANPSLVKIGWKAPEWAGYGGIAKYEIGTRSPAQKHPNWMNMGDKNEATLNLDPEKNWSVFVRATNASGKTNISRELKIMKQNTVLAPEVNPSVSILENNGMLTVLLDKPVGSSKTYPKMDIAIAPTLGGKGFHDQHTISNRANQATFVAVPCGVYTIVVTGNGASSSKEFARTVVNRCDTGGVVANSWKLIFGRADILGNTVDMRYGSESRVISTLPRKTEDMVFTTEADLKSGWGYGIWARANFTSASGVSGYSFQYDPGYANVNKAFGKALLLRVWQNGKECGTPIAKVKWPENVSVNGKHNIVVVAKGDTLYASIDGIRLFDVVSLKDALRDSKCSQQEPHGSQVGFRSWSSDGNVSFTNTTLN